MTNRNLTVILCIILLPVVAGIIALTSSNNGIGKSIDLSSGRGKIGLVRLVDIIMSSEVYVQQLEELRNDETIDGVILRIDSPGGAVAPSQEIYQEVMRYRLAKKPLIVSMGNIAASGGYYIASSATRIFSNPGTITGSIGVIFQFPQYYKLLDKVGVKVTTFKAGEFKDIGNPNREISEKEKLYIQALLDNTHEQFIHDVSVARCMDIKKLRLLANGKIFTGQQALDAGLVDTLGGYSDAVAYLKKLLNLPNKTKVVEKIKTTDFLKDMLSGKLAALFPWTKNRFVPAGCYYLLENF
jgi:protease-4